MPTMTEIVVDPTEAKAKVEEYRAAVREQRSVEDQRLARAFTIAAKGRRIILLNETLHAAGVDDQGRPKMAVCRATSTRCELAIEADRMLFLDNQRQLNTYRYRTPLGGMHVSVPWPDARDTARRLQKESRPELNYPQWGWTAMVPIVPPSCRPPRRHRLHGLAPADPLAACHVLWEAEWTTVAPCDPALIRHIEGDLWEVLATWDLTELERAVITGTRRAT
jgi:hypothetical protein